jgi:hypothetical protein
LLGGSALLRVLVLTLALVGGGCGSDDDCDIEAQSRSLGGAGLEDCGIARGGDSSVVDRCAVTAFEGNKTFRALYELDDGRLQALVHAAGGAYLLLRESDDGVERADCSGARSVRENGRNYIECQDPTEFAAACD